MSGTCKFCGCTQDNACAIDVEGDDGCERPPQPCCWINREYTICSACLPRVPMDELEPLVTRDLKGAMEAEIPMVLDGGTAFVLLSLLHLVLRHPQLASDTPAAHEVASLVAESLEGRFDELSPVLGEISRRGRDPQFDVSRDALGIQPAHPALGEEVSPGGIIIP